MSHHPHCGRCGHVLDHKDKPCGHTRKVWADDGTENAPQVLIDVPCKCGEGVLADVLICRQNSAIIDSLHRIQGASDVRAQHRDQRTGRHAQSGAATPDAELKRWPGWSDRAEKERVGAMSEDQVATTPEVPQTNGPVRSFAQAFKLVGGRRQCNDCHAWADTLPHVCKEWASR